MDKIKCIVCNTTLEVDKIEKGIIVTCNYGCEQKCLDKNEYISRWRVMNPQNFSNI